MSTYPKAPPARSPLTFKQMPVLPSRQLRQRPHAMLKGADTRSPTSKNSTSLPFSMISPVISCPRTIPAGAVVRPRTICWSLPQIFVLTTLRITPCSHFRDPSDNFGKSIGRTSTFPRPTYTTPRLFAINVAPIKNLECFGAGFRHGVILLSGTAANAHGACHFSTAFQRDAAGEHHHAPMIRHVDSEKLTARLRILREILRRNIERARSEG